MKFSGVTILQGVEFTIFPIHFAWALQQQRYCAACDYVLADLFHRRTRSAFFYAWRFRKTLTHSLTYLLTYLLTMDI